MRDESAPYGFLLHDVGKIGIPDGILQKPGPLSPAERRKMETHTVLGEAMLSGVVFLKGEGLKIVRSHHERWDGRGYPDGLIRTEIPLGARIFAVADALNAPFRIGTEDVVPGERRSLVDDLVSDGAIRIERRPEIVLSVGKGVHGAPSPFSMRVLLPTEIGKGGPDRCRHESAGVLTDR